MPLTDLAAEWKRQDRHLMKPANFLSVTLSGSLRSHDVRRSTRPGEIFVRLLGYSRKTTLNNELLIFKPPLYSMNPSLRNLFMKKFTRDRVVPTISASVS